MADGFRKDDFLKGIDEHFERVLEKENGGRKGSEVDAPGTEIGPDTASHSAPGAGTRLDPISDQLRAELRNLSYEEQEVVFEFVRNLRNRGRAT